MNHHYNPDWLSDDALVANFVARQSDFTFLRGELAHAPLTGSAQHYLLVGVRGAGKTTLLKRLAVAIRRDPDLSDHLIALSFPEELYQVKNLSDFWWAACEALVDELDRMNRNAEADNLSDRIEQGRRVRDEQAAISDSGFKLLQESCARLQRRPVLLVDNLDMVFDRIDKTGRKLKDPHSPSYWALREALSTSTAPVVIGGSVRLSTPFTDYDKAFYDFFIPKRLGKLTLAEVREVLERLADAQGVPEIKPRLQARPGRIEALFELTGGNPRALSLIFDLLRNGPNSRAVEDFERLMDITTPYYKSRIEDLSEQAQVVMHALAVHAGSGLQFGSTAAEIADQSGVPTTGVSAQLSLLETEGLVEKSAAHGRTQYRIAEQLFRLWIQMRSSRRIRHNVIGLTRFFEAMYDPEELRDKMKDPCGAGPLAEAKFAFALAGAGDIALSQRHHIEAYGMERLNLHLASHGGKIDDYLLDSDPVRIRRTDEQRENWQVLISEAQTAMADKDMEAAEAALRKAMQIAPDESGPRIQMGSLLFQDNRHAEAEKIIREVVALTPENVHAWILLAGILSKNKDRMPEAEQAVRAAIAVAPTNFGLLIMLALLQEELGRYEEAEDTYRRSLRLNPAIARIWELYAGFLIRQAVRPEDAKDALMKVVELEPENSRAWTSLGGLYATELHDDTEAEFAFLRALKLSPADASLRIITAAFFARLGRYEEAEENYREAIKLDPENVMALSHYGALLIRMDKSIAAESPLRTALQLEPANDRALAALVTVLSKIPERRSEAEPFLRQAIAINETIAWRWVVLGSLLMDIGGRDEEAATIFRKALTLNPSDANLWGMLGDILCGLSNCGEEAKIAYKNAIEHAPEDERLWNNLGVLLADEQLDHSAAEVAYRRAIELAPAFAQAWRNLAELLELLKRDDEALAAYEYGTTLGAAPQYWKTKMRNLRVKIGLSQAKAALNQGDMAGLRDALLLLQANPDDIAAICISKKFIEGFLAPLLTEHSAAAIVLAGLRDTGYDKHARPLLLAFEAAIDNREDMLAELEPEVQGATKILFKRLRDASLKKNRIAPKATTKKKKL